MNSGPAEKARDFYHAGRFSEALALLDLELKSAPGRADLWNNRGTVLAAAARLEEASESFGRALSLSPDFTGAYTNRGSALLALGRYEAAAKDFERGLAANPDTPYALSNLAQCRLQCCDWRDLDALRVGLLRDLHAGRPAVTAIIATSLLDSPMDQLRAAQILAKRHFPEFPPLWRGENYAHEKIRLAYVSADFHSHATATLMAGVFEHHDRAKFETIAISFGPDDGSAMRARLKGAFTRFIDVAGKRDGDIAALLRGLETDIAVDLKGYTSQARPAIFSRRPAPVQVNYLGYPGTMGAPFIDALIADATVVPEGSERFYSERILRLPGCYQANDNTRPIADVSPDRAEIGLPEKGFVFCCFNNSYKILPDMFAIWMRLLGRIEGSVLWLLEDNPAAVRNLRREAESRGIAPSRLIFAARLPPERHLARHACADLFLDTLPYNAHTTASDSLWAGLPVLTAMGTTFAGRVGASILKAAGLSELIADSLPVYEARSLEIARNPDMLARIKTKLRENRRTCALFDTQGFTRDLERAFEGMHANTMGKLL
jgi:protein O-GlcNAc transferase